MNLHSLGTHASGLPGAGKAVLAPQHAIDLLGNHAREFLRRCAGTVQAQRGDLARLHLAGAQTAIGELRFEHAEQAVDAIAPQAQFGIVFGLVLVFVGGRAEHQDFAHCRVGELIMQPAGNAFRLPDLGDGAVRERDQAAIDGSGIDGR